MNDVFTWEEDGLCHMQTQKGGDAPAEKNHYGTEPAGNGRRDFPLTSSLPEFTHVPALTL